MPMAGKKEVTADQADFIEWLVDPSRVGSQNDFARKIGVNPATLTKWKKHDAIFRAAWQKRCDELNVDPETIQDIVQAIKREALNGDMKAAELYLKFVDRFTPKVKIESESVAPKELSDEELERELRELIAAEGER